MKGFQGLHIAGLIFACLALSTAVSAESLKLAPRQIEIDAGHADECLAYQHSNSVRHFFL